MLLGLLSSTYSTLVSQLAAGRFGRDAAVDWMTVAAIPARDWALQSSPTWSAIVGGIAFHQWADFSWALVFFGVFARRTARLRGAQIAAVALPWAALTSALEWFVLVPLIPFAQPVFSLQQPYWIGFLVHASSAAMYPSFVRIHRPRCRAHFATAWIAGAMLLLFGLAAPAFASSRGYEVPWRGGDRLSDQTYMRHMHTHHEQGIALAAMAATRATDPHLAALARLMVAGQTGENRIFESWWQAWFEEPMTVCSPAERAAMPGLLRAEQMTQLDSAPQQSFDTLFIQLMTVHHSGAAAMADQELRGQGDPRLRIMAHAIRHEQQGEIALMHGVSGFKAVQTATRNMFVHQNDEALQR
jgi:uncharacterized protein (DUF305 family)